MTNVTEIVIPIDKYITPIENLKQLGFLYDGVEIDKRGKKHTMFSKDNVDYEFKGADISNSEKVVISLHTF